MKIASWSIIEYGFTSLKIPHVYCGVDSQHVHSTNRKEIGMSKTKFFTDAPKRNNSWGKLGEDLLGGLAKEVTKLSADCAREVYGAAGMPVADTHRTFKGSGKTVILIERK